MLLGEHRPGRRTNTMAQHWEVQTGPPPGRGTTLFVSTWPPLPRETKRLFKPGVFLLRMVFARLNISLQVDAGPEQRRAAVDVGSQRRGPMWAAAQAAYGHRCPPRGRSMPYRPKKKHAEPGQPMGRSRVVFLLALFKSS